MARNGKLIRAVIVKINVPYCASLLIEPIYDNRFSDNHTVTLLIGSVVLADCIVSGVKRGHFSDSSL